jgi:ectoine hydroxylase-related dioxygenase (phytanoyl-CoA dioxygenase family)
MRAISVEDVKQFRQSLDQEGYAVIRNVVSKDHLDEFNALLADEYARAKTTNKLFDGGGSLSGHLNCFPGEQSRFIYEDILDYGIVEVARAIDPVKAEIVRPTLNYNLPNSVAQFYHMDGLFTDPFLICNVAVVDTDLDNGAIDVLPGTNRRFYKFWRYAVERKYRLSTRLCLERGDVLLRMSTLWHRGMPNRTTVPRPMMSLTFGEQGTPTGDPFVHNDGNVEFYPNWFKTDRLGRLRERIFVTMPWTDSTFRFARSIFSNKGYSSW